MRTLIFFGGIMILSLFLISAVQENGQQNSDNDELCQNLYWIDNDNPECSRKQFCGAYMYYGLQTFESKQECLRGINSTQNADNPGREVSLEVHERNRIRIQTQNGSADTDLNISEEQDENGTRLMVNMSNGRRGEVKIMPETASQRAIERLGELGFTIVLKEVGRGNETKLAYDLNSTQSVKVLGFMKAKMKVNAEVDAETGEIIRVKKPWWAFLARED